MGKVIAKKSAPKGKVQTKKTTKAAAVKKPAAKSAKTSAPAKVQKKAPAAAKKAVKKAPCQKACKANPAKKCCGKKDCDCQSTAITLISEIFGRLSDTKAVEELLKDYFFTELLKRGFDESAANNMCNRLSVQIANFDANIDID